MIETRPEYPPEFDDADPQDVIDDLREELTAEKARLDWMIAHDLNRIVEQYPSERWEARTSLPRTSIDLGMPLNTPRDAIDAAMGGTTDVLPKPSPSPLDDLMENPIEILLGMKARG